jgi:hypothetical protein
MMVRYAEGWRLHRDAPAWDALTRYRLSAHNQVRRLLVPWEVESLRRWSAAPAPLPFHVLARGDEARLVVPCHTGRDLRRELKTMPAVPWLEHCEFELVCADPVRGDAARNILVEWSKARRMTCAIYLTPNFRSSDTF